MGEAGRETLGETLQAWAAGRGYQVAFGHPAVLEVIRAEMELRRSNGEFSQEFRDRYLHRLTYLDGVDLQAVRSVAVIAAATPARVVRFALPDGPLEAVLPPVVAAGKAPFEAMTRELEAGPLGGVRFRLAPFPFKACASRLGLVTYGRNNITQAAGLGSYFMLFGYAVETSLVAPGASHEPCVPPRLAAVCEDCGACVAACPTRALDEGRFLPRAERCLNSLHFGDAAWPEWLDPKAHRWLFGCQACQDVCPANRGLLRTVALEPAFTEAETARILADTGGAPGFGDDALGVVVRDKVAAIGLGNWRRLLGRNLRALVAAQQRENE